MCACLICVITPGNAAGSNKASTQVARQQVTRATQQHARKYRGGVSRLAAHQVAAREGNRQGSRHHGIEWFKTTGAAELATQHFFCWAATRLIINPAWCLKLLQHFQFILHNVLSVMCIDLKRKHSWKPYPAVLILLMGLCLLLIQPRLCSPSHSTESFRHFNVRPCPPGLWALLSQHVANVRNI